MKKQRFCVYFSKFVNGTEHQAYAPVYAVSTEEAEKLFIKEQKKYSEDEFKILRVEKQSL